MQTLKTAVAFLKSSVVRGESMSNLKHVMTLHCGACAHPGVMQERALDRLDLTYLTGSDPAALCCVALMESFLCA